MHINYEIKAFLVLGGHFFAQKTRTAPKQQRLFTPRDDFL